jgi:hypothetical protein
MKNARALILIGMVIFCPGRAYAGDGWWDWLDAFSGPGPFHGASFSEKLWCPQAANQQEQQPLRKGFYNCGLSDRSTDIKAALTLSASWLTSGSQPRFRDLDHEDPNNTRSVTVFRLDPAWNVRIHETLDFGFGVGYMRVSGDGFEPLNRVTITPASVTFVPFASVSDSHWGRVFRIKFGVTFVPGPGDISGSDFGAPEADLQLGSEMLPRMSVGVDFGSIWSAITKE